MKLFTPLAAGLAACSVALTPTVAFAADLEDINPRAESSITVSAPSDVQVQLFKAHGIDVSTREGANTVNEFRNSGVPLDAFTRVGDPFDVGESGYTIEDLTPGVYYLAGVGEDAARISSILVATPVDEGSEWDYDPEVSLHLFEQDTITSDAHGGESSEVQDITGTSPYTKTIVGVGGILAAVAAAVVILRKRKEANEQQ